MGLLLDHRSASAVVSGRQTVLPMHFECRWLKKGQQFFIATSRSSPERGLLQRLHGPDEHKQGEYSIVAKVSFVGNRRLSDDKLLALGAQHLGTGLPGNSDELDALKSCFPATLQPRRHTPAWMVELIEQFNPPLVWTHSSDTDLDWKDCFDDRLAIVLNMPPVAECR